jgi:hypothetical protein
MRSIKTRKPTRLSRSEQTRKARGEARKRPILRDLPAFPSIKLARLWGRENASGWFCFRVGRMGFMCRPMEVESLEVYHD